MSDSQSPGPSSSTPRPRAGARPRAGIQRKSKQEREEYARKEAERAKEREAAETKSTPKIATPSTRGRGAARGRGARDGGQGRSDSGVFGSSAQRLERRVAETGYSEVLDGGGSATASIAGVAGQKGKEIGVEVVDVDGPGTSGSKSAGGGGKGRGTKTTTVEETYHAQPEDEEEGTRRDIERIWISSDEDEEIIAHRKRRRSSKAARPFHGLRPVRASRNLPEEREQEGQPVPKEQEERTLEVSSDEMVVDDPEFSTKDSPSSPELSRRLKKSDSRSKDTKVLTETTEERKERRRLEEDVDKLKDAFLHKSDTDDTVDSKEEEIFGRTDHDRMFLFQLPPLVPQLYDPNKPQQAEEPPETDRTIKIEDAAAAENTKKTTPPPSTIYSADAKLHERFPQGFVGKLNIHKSGKVTLNWGGTSMEVRYGTDVDFLQDVVCVEEGDNVEGDIDERIGKAYALGQVDKKMVLVPDWTRLYG